MTDKNGKKKLPPIVRFVIRFFQIIVYIPLQMIFIPFAVIGLLHALYREMVRSRKLDVSFSAVQALQYRWIMHYFQTRPDPVAVAFIKQFPCESHFGLWTAMGALIIAQRIFGFRTRLGKLVERGEEKLDSTAGIRVLVFDGIIEKYIDEMEQIVLPGAGFDLISLRYTEGKNVRVFELDQENTLKIKVDTLRKAGIGHDWITYIPVDYSNESWADKLVEAGFDRMKKTLFLWQSVSLFLESGTVRETLREMADLSADGSVIAQDFYSEAFLSGEISKIAVKNMNMIGKMGEPWKFAIDMSDDPAAAVGSFLKECGLEMTVFTRFGEKLGIEPYYCIVEAVKEKR
jgi:methyltransferase (TIGR00027 family)